MALIPGLIPRSSQDFWPYLSPPSLLQAAWSWPEGSRRFGGELSLQDLWPRLPKADTVGPHSAWVCLSISVSLFPTPSYLSLSLSSLPLSSLISPLSLSSLYHLSLSLSLSHHTIPSSHPLVHPDSFSLGDQACTPPSPAMSKPSLCVYTSKGRAASCDLKAWVPLLALARPKVCLRSMQVLLCFTPAKPHVATILVSLPTVVSRVQPPLWPWALLPDTH